MCKSGQNVYFTHLYKSWCECSNNVYWVFIADEHISVEMKVTHIHNICNSAKNNINDSAGFTCEAIDAAALGPK